MKHHQEMKRNLMRKLLGGLSLTTAAFIFQACYGSMQDFGLDVYISGQVRSYKTGMPVKGIRVSVVNNPQYLFTAEDGSFSLYTVSASECRLIFEDIDAGNNGTYMVKDTTLLNPTGEIHLEILLKEY
jgi:hypothetical protein